MYITGEITTATFALIENTKTLEYKDKRKGPTESFHHPLL